MKIFIAIVSLILLADGVAAKHHPKPTPSPTPTPTPTPVPQITLAWNPSAGASGYYFKYGFSSGAETAIIDVRNVTVWTLQLQSGTTYYFVVSAYNSAGESGPSNEVVYATP